MKHPRKRDENSVQPMSRIEKKLFKIGSWLIIIGGILMIILKALNNRVIGYDHFPSIPIEWIKWLK